MTMRIRQGSLRSRFQARGAALVLLILGFGASAAAQPPPFADIHLHYTWSQAEVTEPEEAVAALRRHNVVLGVVAGWPSERALELAEASDGRVLALFSPYIEGMSRYDWYRDPRVLERTREALASGRYVGIGEVHLSGSRPPARDNRIFQGLLDLAAEFDVPVLLHTEASDHRFVVPVCQGHPEVRFLWAHAGGILGAGHSRGLLEACDNVWVELSARDPDHYGSLVDAEGRLPDPWRELIADYPERFMTGTDPVWNAQQVYRWYEADEGWRHYDALIAFHRDWLGQLPPDLERRLRLTNALDFFGVER